MKTLLLLFVAIAIGAFYVFSLNNNYNGTALGQEAATAYCNMVRLQNAPNQGNVSAKDLEMLKLKHAGLMQRGYALDGDARVDFTKTYASMVSHCN